MLFVLGCGEHIEREHTYGCSRCTVRCALSPVQLRVSTFYISLFWFTHCTDSPYRPSVLLSLSSAVCTAITSDCSHKRRSTAAQAYRTSKASSQDAMGSILVTDALLCSVLFYSILLYSTLFYFLIAVVVCCPSVRISYLIPLETLALAPIPAPICVVLLQPFLYFVLSL